MLRTLFHLTAEKELARIPARSRERIIEKIKRFSQLNHPLQHHQVIKLEGGKEERFRLRIGDYRVKFTFHKPSTLLITHIQHRQAGY